MSIERSEWTSSVRRTVVKVGSGVLTDQDGRLDPETIERLAEGIAPLMKKPQRVAVVSSGAIAIGLHVLKQKTRPQSMAGLQAAAAVGQSKLVETWSRAFQSHQIPVAQVLLTHADLADRKRFLNAR